MIQVKPVETKSDWTQFLDLPSTIYQGDPIWVPPLRVAVREQLDVKKNPFFKHAFMYPLLAFKNGKCVGRVVGILDERHNEFHDEKTAFFGYFEAINDQEVANHLVNAVVKWAKEKGMATLRGPVSPSTNHECGLLVEGFKDSPTIMMTYNPPYYQSLLETCGFIKAKDLFAYLISYNSKFSEKLTAQAERLKQAGKVTFRPVRMNDYEQELKKIHEIYNDAWEKNWGFVPMDADEFWHMAKDLKQIMDPELCLIAEVQGKPAGFALTLPDVNQAFKKVKNGKLTPAGILKLLWHAKGPGKKKTINRCRILTLGIKKNYREFGIGPMLYLEYLKRGPALGYPCGEASWILEDNIPMNKALHHMAGERTKVYRIYDRTLA